MTNEQIAAKLDLVLEAQATTNDHLSRLNGKVADHSRWIAVREDREKQEEKREKGRLSTGMFWLGVLTIVATIAVAIIAIALGSHGSLA
jgi:hypothetical protein